MDHKQFFDWLRSSQPDGKLTHTQVVGANSLLFFVVPTVLQRAISNITGWPIAVASKKVTKSDIYQAAKELGVEAAMIKALSDTESPEGGFYKDGRPVILFERHKFYQGLTAINWITKRNEMVAKYPDVCNRSAGAYNVRGQYAKMAIAEALNWDVAHESASWGFGQVMGFNWKLLGYDSIRDFVTRMYASEGEQLIATCRYIKVTGLDKKLRAKDWAGFAFGYNGSAYKKNRYDTRLAAAYAKAKREGW